MKIKLLAIVIFILSTNLSCRRLYFDLVVALNLYKHLEPKKYVLWHDINGQWSMDRIRN